MLRLADVSDEDVVYDLGSGDGRILIAAAELYRARGVGIDIDPKRVQEGRANARRERVQDLVTFRNEDLFTTNISEASVVTLFLWPKVNLKLRPKLLRELRTGARVVSYFWDMGDWAPNKHVTIDGVPIYLWIIPPREDTRPATADPQNRPAGRRVSGHIDLGAH
jgi:SAM-dependent methyltransferase